MPWSPRWVRTLKPVWIAHHRLRRLAAGHFILKPMTYSIYTLQSPEQRVPFDVAQSHGHLVEPVVTGLIPSVSTSPARCRLVEPPERWYGFKSEAGCFP